MADPVAAWHAEHEYFNRLLSLLHKQLDVFHSGDRPTTFTTKEAEAAFKHLEKHCPDLQLVLARLNQEHRVIAHAGETLRDLLQGIVDGAVISRAEVEVAAATYLVYYGNHIAKEEEDVLGRAAESLTKAEWEEGGGSQEHYKELRRQIALET